MLKKIFLNIYLKIYRIDASGFSSKDEQQLAMPLKVNAEGGSNAVAYMESEAISDKIYSPKSKSKQCHRLTERKRSRYSLPTELSTISQSPLMEIPQTHNHEMKLAGNDLEVEHSLKRVFSQIEFITKIKAERNRREALRIDWELLGTMLDRLYFWFFMIIVLVSNVYILSSVYVARGKLNVVVTDHLDEE